MAVPPLAGRMGEQRSHVALTAFGCALLGVAWLVPVADHSTVAIAAFLLASAGGRAGLNTFSYLLAGSGAEPRPEPGGRGHRARQPQLGVAAVIGPLAASVAHGNVDERIPFGIIAALCLAAATLMFTSSAGYRTQTELVQPSRPISSAAVGMSSIAPDQLPHTGNRRWHRVPGERRRVVVTRDLGARPEGDRRREPRLVGDPVRDSRPAPTARASVAQDAVRRMRPVAVEQTVRAVAPSPAATSRSCSHRARRSGPWPRSACRHRCRRAACVCARDVVLTARPPAAITGVGPASDDGVEQVRQRGRRLHVPSGLDALRDQHVGAVGHRLARASIRPDLDEHARARLVATRHALTPRLPPET